MDFYDILNETFDTNDSIEIEEGVFLTNPFLAYSVLKKKVVENPKNKIYDVKDNISKSIKNKELEAKKTAILSKEKLTKKALGKSGFSGDDTVYKLTKEQKETMAEMYEKYGDELIKQIMEFRDKVLSPYSVIKRQVKKASTVSSLDVMGITKKEADKLVSSAKKKIEQRGSLSEDYEELKKTSRKIDGTVKALKKIKEDVEKGEINEGILRRLYKKLELNNTDFEGYSKQDLNLAYNTLEKSKKVISSELEKIKKDGYDADEEKREKILKHIKDSRAARAGRVDLLRRNKYQFYYKPKYQFYYNDKDDESKGSGKTKRFNTALAKYSLRRSIKDKILKGKGHYIIMYKEIINELLEAERKKREELIKKLDKLTKDLSLTKEEKVVVEPKAGGSWKSDEWNDFVVKYDPEDFKKANKKIKKSKKLSKAEQEIENEIKRFERSLKKIVSEEDFQKLKKYRLINNLISVRELKSPNKLFKSSSEIEKMEGEDDSSKDDEGGDE